MSDMGSGADNFQLLHDSLWQHFIPKHCIVIVPCHWLNKACIVTSLMHHYDAATHTPV